MEHRPSPRMPAAVGGQPHEPRSDGVHDRLPEPPRQACGADAVQPGEGAGAIEFWEERAGVREFCGGQQRLTAESGALRDVIDAYGREAGRDVQRHRGILRD